MQDTQPRNVRNSRLKLADRRPAIHMFLAPGGAPGTFAWAFGRIRPARADTAPRRNAIVSAATRGRDCMRGKDNMRNGGEVLVDQLLVNGVRHVFCVPGESYLAALDAFHDRDIAVTVCRQEGGAVMMAEAAGKLTGRPGIAFVTRGPGATNGSPGLHIAHAGFHADDHVRRTGRARDARARGVPGARLPRGVRHDGEMGDRDRRSGAHSRDRVARVPRRDERPSRPGGDRAARGHADGARLGRRCARRRSDRDLARPHRHVAAAEDALGGREADR